MNIEFHADDYGFFPLQSKRILKCHIEGRLNGVSIIPNSKYLNECMEFLLPYKSKIAVTVHLNLFDGSSVCDPKEIPLLIDENGNLNCSFGKLMLHSFLPMRKLYLQQLKKELSLQIKALQQICVPLRLDSHAHYHMIPVVFDALMEVIQEEGLDVSYIRIPKEYPSLYLCHWWQLKDLSLVNLVKVAVLNLLVWRNCRKHGQYLGTLDQKLFMGVFLSGRMYRENVELVLQDAVELARKKRMDIEILAHPGGVYEETDIAQLTSRDDVVFLKSEARNQEMSLYI